MAKSTDLKYLILNSNEPILFKNCIDNWPLLKFDLGKWRDKFMGKSLPVRVGHKKYSKQQWERLCKIDNINFDDFLNKYSTSEDKWAYFDYKYMHEWFNEDINESFHWGDLGFDDLKYEDSTLWIGTSGAHTPCHYDTYSCNLVAQVYGHKRWILMPPVKIQDSNPMKPQRIPYEESSVYSGLDFYSPKDINKFNDIEKPIIIILEPGDVLFVPKHWWHFVENIDFAISVNTWIPLETDDENRLEESLVRVFAAAMIQTSTFDKQEILNPNEDNLCSEDISQSIKYLSQTMKTFLDPKHDPNKREDNTISKKDVCKEIMHKYKKNINILAHATTKEFQELLQHNSKRHLHNDPSADGENNSETIKNVINSFCNPRVINLVKQLFIEEYTKK